MPTDKELNWSISIHVYNRNQSIYTNPSSSL